MTAPEMAALIRQAIQHAPFVDEVTRQYRVYPYEIAVANADGEVFVLAVRKLRNPQMRRRA
jgi:hypothetical protein